MKNKRKLLFTILGTGLLSVGIAGSITGYLGPMELEGKATNIPNIPNPIPFTIKDNAYKFMIESQNFNSSNNTWNTLKNANSQIAKDLKIEFAKNKTPFQWLISKSKSGRFVFSGHNINYTYIIADSSRILQGVASVSWLAFLAGIIVFGSFPFINKKSSKKVLNNKKVSGNIRPIKKEAASKVYGKKTNAVKAAPVKKTINTVKSVTKPKATVKKVTAVKPKTTTKKIATTKKTTAVKPKTTTKKTAAGKSKAIAKKTVKK